MLLLIYFDRLIGPKIILTEPKNLLDALGENYTDLIKGLLDSSEEGFFTHYFSQDLRTANYIFSLKSPVARGYSELLMISAIISEDEPDIQGYKESLTKFVKKIQQFPDIYKAFYINSISMDKKEEALKCYNYLKEQFNNLYKILSIKKIETEGCLYSFSKIKRENAILIPKEVINKINSLRAKGQYQNFFIVFRTRGDIMKIDMIPINKTKVIRLAIIFGEQMTITILQKISEIFSKYDKEVKLVFTSGICQEIDKCIYEVYVDIEEDILEKILKEISIIQGVLEIDVKIINLEE